MPTLPTLTDYVNGQVLTEAMLDGDFGTIRTYFNTYAVLTDVSKTITVTHTFSASQTFSAGLTVSASGITVTGNSTITGTLGGLTGLTVASGGITVTGNSTISGTLGSLTGITMASGTAALQALTCTTFTPSGLAQGAIAAYVRYSAGDTGATPAINWSNGNTQRWRLTAAATPTFSNPVKGAFYVLELQQDGTGSRTVTWSGATIVWPDGVTPTLTTTANRKDVITLYCIDATSSGTYLGAMFGQNYNNTTS